MKIHPPIVSRTKGGCSVCNRGHGFKGAPRAKVTLIKIAPPSLTPAERAAAAAEGARLIEGMWCGICLKCAALVAKELAS